MLDVLDAAASANVEYIFSDVTGERTTVKFEDLWRDANAMADTLEHRSGQTAALMLTPDPKTIAALLGAWIAGVHTVSLPTPARGQAIEAYVATIESLCNAADVSFILGRPDFPIPSLGEIVDVGTLADNPPKTRCVQTAISNLIQCSSGSTSHPKGVVLSTTHLLHNIDAILARATPVVGGAATVGWLPLSHDMGLIGLFLCPLVAAVIRPSANKTQVVLDDPGRFVRNPHSWVELIGEFKAVNTVGPPFGMDRLAAFVERRGTDADLSSLAQFTVGSEMVRVEMLERFIAAFQPQGLNPMCLCPSYGMAEVGLAVSMDRHDTMYSVADVSIEALNANGVLAPASVVTAGPPLLSSVVTVDAADTHGIGELVVASPSVGNYLHADIGQGHHTSDIGFIASTGHVVPLGRLDDVIVVAGRNVLGWDIDAAAIHPAIKYGHAVGVSDGNNGLALVAERLATTPMTDAPAIELELKRQVRNALGVSPSRLVLIEPNTFPRTPSGKVQRRKLAELANR